MNDQIIFRILVLLLFGSFLAHRGYYTQKYSAAGLSPETQLESNLLQKAAGLLTVPALLGVIAYLIQPAWMAWSALTLPAWMRWCGLITAAGGFILLQSAHHALGRNWSDVPGVQTGHTLVTDGPYRAIRHPIYTAFLLILGSPLLLSANWFVGGLWLLTTAIETTVRVPAEEALMTEKFGEAYTRYRQRTGALLPWIG